LVTVVEALLVRECHYGGVVELALGDNFVVFVDERLGSVVLKLVRLQLWLLGGHTQGLRASLTLVKLLNALEPYFSETADLLIPRRHPLACTLVLLRTTPLFAFLLFTCLVVIGFDVLEDVGFFLFGQVFTLRVRVIHGDIAI
jgi:hypothetical protein